MSESEIMKSTAALLRMCFGVTVWHVEPSIARINLKKKVFWFFFSPSSKPSASVGADLWSGQGLTPSTR
jgi:hypothetical protein